MGLIRPAETAALGIGARGESSNGRPETTSSSVGVARAVTAECARAHARFELAARFDMLVHSLNERARCPLSEEGKPGLFLTS